MITISLSKNFLRAVLCLLVLGAVAVACGNDNAITTDQAITDQQLKLYQIAQPVPHFTWSRQRDTMIQIYNLLNEATQTWSVFMSNTGVAIDSCPSVGFPIPAGTQLTNPEQLTWANSSGSSYGYGAIAQMEPNGLYSSPNTDGTWVLCVRPNGDVEPRYSEPLVMTYAHAVQISNGHIVDVPDSPSTAKVKIGSAPVVAPTPGPSPHP